MDSKGNLYVANVLGNNVLVYNTSYVQKTAATITKNIALPVGVAFDPYGNLWVANANTSNSGVNGSIAEYFNGVQTNSVILAGIADPYAIAIDALSNVWVNNNLGNITVYSPPSAFYNPSTPQRVITTNLPFSGLAVARDVVAFANAIGVQVSAIEPLMVTGQTDGPFFPFSGAVIGGASDGTFYVGNADGTVDQILTSGATNLFATLATVPAGIAVDLVRGRVYISTGFSNTIEVYSTAGVLLHTIQ